MVTQNDGGAGDDDKNPGGDDGGDDKGKGSGGTGDDDGKPISRSDHQRALDDMHRFKREARETKTRLDALQAQIDSAKADGEKEKGNFKSLYEQSEAARLDEKKNSERLKQSVITSERARNLFPELKKAGLREDAQNLIDKIDLSDIEVEATSSGRFICHGIDLFVEKVKAEYPFAFEQKRAPRIDNGRGSGGNGGGNGKGTWTPQTLFTFEQQCKSKGNMVPYHEAVAEYKKAKQAAK